MNAHSIAKQAISALVIAPIILVACALSASSQQPYYGFFPSSRGEQFKKFVHNILGFSIDIPSTWIFGVNGTPPTAVVFLYPEGINTGIFSADYEVIEVGQIPAYTGTTLQKAQENVMSGMKTSHPNLKFLQNPAATSINGRAAVKWTYQWTSKTGLTIIEYIALVESSSGIRSLAVRTARNDFYSRQPVYDAILNTFEPFQSKY